MKAGQETSIPLHKNLMTMGNMLFLGFRIETRLFDVLQGNI